MTKQLRIATRKSPLALWQAEHVKSQLQAQHPGLEVTLVPMTTKGDKILDVPLAKVGGKGLFVKELEQALLQGDADIAVHSIKDVPMDFPDGLFMPTVLRREDPYDAFVSANYADLEQLPQGAKVGTSSLRRQCQLLQWRSDIQLLDLRGNVGTRLGKLDQGDYDAIILAKAGLIRLGNGGRISQSVPDDIILPAVGQGAIGIECRRDDQETQPLLAVLNDPPTHTRVAAERAFNHRLNGGCQVPIGGFAELEKDTLFMRGLVGKTDGSEIIKGSISGRPTDAEELGTVLAEDLLSRGADRILKELGLGL